MKAELEKKTDDFIKSLCNDIYEYLKGIAGQSVCLRDIQWHYFQIESIHCVTYKRLYIDDNTVMVDYCDGEGAEPFDYEECTEELSKFELQEIQDIIKSIEE